LVNSCSNLAHYKKFVHRNSFVTPVKVYHHISLLLYV
jgi:hypothetical protein